MSNLCHIFDCFHVANYDFLAMFIRVRVRSGMGKLRTCNKYIINVDVTNLYLVLVVDPPSPTDVVGVVSLGAVEPVEAAVGVGRVLVLPEVPLVLQLGRHAILYLGEILVYFEKGLNPSSLVVRAAMMNIDQLCQDYFTPERMFKKIKYDVF